MKNKSFFRYLIELLIVIVGVTVAFWLNTRAEAAKERKTLTRYYEELRSDLAADQRTLTSNIENNQDKQELMMRAMQLYQTGNATTDSVFFYSQEIGNYHFFVPNDITYRTMINSGDLKLIDDLELKRKILKLQDRYQTIELLQDNHLQALDQNFFPKYVYMVDYITGQPLEAMEENILVKNYFGWSANELGLHIAYYKSALKINQELDSLIQVKL